MADGIRIQPTDATLTHLGLLRGDMANRPWIVRDINRPFEYPYRACPDPDTYGCRDKVHECKTYHWTFDADGTRTVSTIIWEFLRSLFDDGGMEPVNVVAKPPTQHIEMIGPTIQLRPATM